MDERRMGLNLGCGDEYKASTPEMRWVNVDLDPNKKAEVRTCVTRVHFMYGPIFDEILAKDILEHVPTKPNHPQRWFDVMRTWVWCLRVGGTLTVQVPDPRALLTQLDAGTIDEDTVNRVLFGTNTGELDRHYQVFTLARLQQAMRDLGLEIVSAENLHVCAIVVGRKR